MKETSLWKEHTLSLFTNSRVNSTPKMQWRSKGKAYRVCSRYVTVGLQSSAVIIYSSIIWQWLYGLLNLYGPWIQSWAAQWNITVSLNQWTIDVNLFWFTHSLIHTDTEAHIDSHIVVYHLSLAHSPTDMQHTSGEWLGGNRSCQHGFPPRLSG